MAKKKSPGKTPGKASGASPGPATKSRAGSRSSSAARKSSTPSTKAIKATPPKTTKATKATKATKKATKPKKTPATPAKATKTAKPTPAKPKTTKTTKTTKAAKGPASGAKASGKRDPNAAWWSVLESAWKQAAPGLGKVRAKMAANRASEDDYDRIEEALEEVVSELQALCDEMPAPALLEVDRALERVLYQLDRQDIQEVTDGSDDGFLYCRGFIAAIGQAYVEAVLEDPSVARIDHENGDVPYLPFHAYQRRFGEMPASPQGISRESCSNPEGWQE